MKFDGNGVARQSARQRAAVNSVGVDAVTIAEAAEHRLRCGVVRCHVLVAKARGAEERVRVVHRTVRLGHEKHRVRGRRDLCLLKKVCDQKRSESIRSDQKRSEAIRM